MASTAPIHSASKAGGSMRIPFLALGACTLALAGCVVPPPYHHGPGGHGPGYDAGPGYGPGVGGAGVYPNNGHATPYQYSAPAPGPHYRSNVPSPYNWGR